MKNTFKALFFCCIFLLYLNSVKAQYLPPLLSLKGTWIFEKAEYMERQSFAQKYVVKYTIEHEDDLYSLEGYFSNLVKKAIFSDHTVTIYDLYTRYHGQYYISIQETSPDKQIELIVGNPEEIGLESMEPGTVFDAPGLRYLVDKTNENTIGITVENTYKEDSFVKYGAVRCILRKID